MSRVECIAYRSSSAVHTRRTRIRLSTAALRADAAGTPTEAREDANITAICVDGLFSASRSRLLNVLVIMGVHFREYLLCINSFSSRLCLPHLSTSWSGSWVTRSRNNTRNSEVKRQSNVSWQFDVIAHFRRTQTPDDHWKHTRCVLFHCLTPSSMTMMINPDYQREVQRFESFENYFIELKTPQQSSRVIFY